MSASGVRPLALNGFLAIVSSLAIVTRIFSALRTNQQLRNNSYFKSSGLVATLALVVLCMPLGIAMAAETGQVVYEGSHVAQDFSWAVDETGARYPTLAGARTLQEPGLPMLPAREILILVPLNSDVNNIWIEPLNTHREYLATELPVAADLAVSTGSFIQTRSMPSEGTDFPMSWGRSGGTHTWRGHRLLAVTIYPVRQIVVDGQKYLEYLDDFAVRAEFTAADGIDDVVHRERLVVGEAEANDRILRTMVVNPEAVASYARPDGVMVKSQGGGFAPAATPTLSGSGVDYLIITNEAMKATFQQLADFKTQAGMPTVVVTREFIAANNRNGADIQETMRMFVRDAYTLWGIKYVLLGGDSDILPPRYIDNSFYPTSGFTSIPCDLYFGCLDGNWNADGDSNYGQPFDSPDPGDLVDFAEEVQVGRATVSTVAEAAVFVNKNITYEMTGAGATWTNRALFASEILFPSEYDPEGFIILDGANFSTQQVNDHIVPCTTMEYMRMYETDAQNAWDTELTRAALIDTLNTGRYGIFNQIGHGYYFNMSVADANFVTTDADGLTNGDHAFVLYALNCASAAFDNSCLMERFVKNPNGGSVISIGSARAAFPNNSNNYQQNFFGELYCGTERRAGDLMALSRLPYIGLTESNYVDRWTFENYTIIGDPSLPIWTGIPEAIAVSGVAAINPGSQSLVYVVTAGGVPVPNATVCVSKDGEDYVYGTTDTIGEVTLDFLPVSPGNAEITVSGKNIVRTTINLPVVAASSYLAVNTMPLADDGTDSSVGNGNGIADSGETLALSPIFQETGGTAETGLSAVLTCDHPDVTVVNGNATVDNVTAGGFASVQSPFLVTLGPDIPDGTKLVFDMVLTGAGGTYETKWDVNAAAPEPEIVAMSWDDSVYGNGDGFLSDGERVVVTAELKNFGNGLLDIASAVLRTPNSNVTIFDSTAAWTNVGLMDEQSASTTFSMAIVQLSKSAKSWLLLTDNYGRTTQHFFTLPRPVAPLGIVTDTSLGADVIALRWQPSISTDVYGYNVLRSQNQGGPFVRVNEDVIANVSYYRDENLGLLTRYYYQIAAVDSSRMESDPSSIIIQSTAPAEREGFPVAFEDETSSHSVVGDVDGDGDLEIVIASSQVYVWHHDGLELLDGDSNSQTLGNFTNYPVGTLLQPAALALANLDGIPGAEIIVSERTPGSTMIHALRKDGTESPGWPKSTGGVSGTTWNWAAPAIGDIDGDGEDEVVVNTLNGRVWAWNADGTEVFDGDANPATDGLLYVRAGANSEWSRSGPALYDLDGDGADDIIFGTKNDSSGIRRIMAIKSDGTDVAGFPYQTLGAIDCDPAVGDLDNNGVMEIVFFCKSRYVYAVQADGTNYPGFPVQTPYTAGNQWVSSPGLGDMDGDGMLEIIYAPNATGLSSKICVVDTDYSGGTSGDLLPGFPIDLPGSSEGSPIVGDIDGDSSPDILHGIGGGNETAPYNLYAYHSDGSPIDGFPITLTGPVMTSVTITDIDNDLDVDLVYGGWDFKMHVWDMPFAFDRVNVPWPTFGGNVKRNGVFMPLSLVNVEDNGGVPAAGFTVMSPYPNPFNPSTSVRMYIPAGRDLDLSVYDVAGRKVRTLHTGSISSGWHTLVWDGQDDSGRGQASGVYFMRAASGPESTIKKMTLVK